MATGDGNYVTLAQMERFLQTTFSATSAPTNAQMADFTKDAKQDVFDDITRFLEQEDITHFLPDIYSNSDGDWGQANGSNTVFFVRDGHGGLGTKASLPIADYAVSGTVDTSDIRVDLLETTTDIWTENATVSSIDAKRGKLTLAAAPTATQLVYITFTYYVSGSDPAAFDRRTRDKSIMNKTGVFFVESRNTPNTISPSYSLNGFSYNAGSSSGSAAKQSETFEKNYKRDIRRLRRWVGEVR